jgi:ring-1,2-phenylacetyl-CoA epoxidase subunit PaaB
VPSALITASSPDEKDPLFDPSDDKVYRHASFYQLPPEVGHM